jgi:hypothetical protein
MLSLPIMACPIFASGRIYNPSADLMSERVITRRYMRHYLGSLGHFSSGFEIGKCPSGTCPVCARGAAGSQWEGYMSDNLAM